jgi:DNA repair exonuclease SbcCD nuclease subunit
MRVLFTADLHINLRQKNVPKKWAIKRYEILFQELDRIYFDNECDLIVFGGDIFDKSPSLEELGLFCSHLWAYSNHQNSIIYDGNHEATKKGDTFLKHLKIMVPSSCKIITDITHIDNMCILPYCKLYENEENPIQSLCGTKILLTHVRGEIPPHVKPEVDLSIFDSFQIVFAGDLHAHSNSQRNIVYPGSPVTVTFHRNPVKTGVIVFDTDTPLKWEWQEITVPQLIRKTIDNPVDMLKTDYNHTIYELRGDLLDLAKVKDMDILDKKIVEHKSEAALNLKGLNLEEEMSLYCSKILQLPNEKITKLLKVYNDNTQEINLE